MLNCRLNLRAVKVFRGKFCVFALVRKSSACANRTDRNVNTWSQSPLWRNK